MAPSTNARLNAWVEEVAALTTPENIRWCDGSENEWQQLTSELVDAGTFVRLPRSQTLSGAPLIPPTLLA